MLPRGALIDYSALPHFDLKTDELFISALVGLCLGNSHHIGLHFGVQQHHAVHCRSDGPHGGGRGTVGLAHFSPTRLALLFEYRYKYLRKI